MKSRNVESRKNQNEVLDEHQEKFMAVANDAAVIAGFLKNRLAKRSGRITKKEIRKALRMDVNHSIEIRDCVDAQGNPYKRYYELGKGIKQGSQVGVGGQGVVKLGREIIVNADGTFQYGEWLAPKVALKNADGSRDEKYDAIFLKTAEHDAEIMRALGYDAFVTVREDGSNRCTLFMPYYPHSDLYDMIVDDKLSPDEKLLCAVSILQEFQKMHDAGYVHCDIKPENIIYDPKKRRTYIIDFGATHKLNEQYDLCGTLEYMDTRLFHDKTDKFDVNIDRFSLACTLYALLEKRWLFEVKKDRRYLDPDFFKSPYAPLIFGLMGQASVDLLGECDEIKSRGLYPKKSLSCNEVIAEIGKIISPENINISAINAAIDAVHKKYLLMADHPDAAAELKRCHTQLRVLTDELIDKNTLHKTGIVRVGRQEYAAYTENMNKILNPLTTSEKLTKHRGVKKVLTNLGLVLGSLGFGLGWLYKTADQRGSFWLQPDTDSVTKLKKVAETIKPLPARRRRVG